MGYSIDFLVCDKKSQILPGCAEYTFTHVDRAENRSGNYHGNMRIREDYPICKDYLDAVEAINRMAGGRDYADFAVRFYDVGAVKKTKKLESLEKRHSEMVRKHVEYEAEHSVMMQKAVQIGCKTCGSKITKSYLKSESCPICGKDLRADCILKRLDKFYEDEKTLKALCRAEEQKSLSKAPIKWCYKVEVYC